MKSTDISTDTYRINEIFYSLQGEGYHTGTPAVFIRLSGCNRACTFCDTDFAHFSEMTAAEIVAEVEKYPTRHVVITGGEPTLQLTEDHDSLLRELKAHNYYIQIETNGSLPVSPLVDWVTCSPKEPPYGIDRIDELKLVYQGHDMEHFLTEFSAKFHACGGATPIFLQPCSGENIPQTIDYILNHPHWRLSLQTHKLLDIR